VGAVPLLGEAEFASNTMWPRPTSKPSGILIHPTVWPQYTNVTDTQTDNGPTAYSANRFTNGHPKNYVSVRPIRNLNVEHQTT